MEIPDDKKIAFTEEEEEFLDAHCMYVPHYEAPKKLLPALLFLTTIFTTITAGAFFSGVMPFDSLSDFLKGVPFSLSLLVILAAHEFGHYLAAVKHKVRSTLPFFIPAPPIPPMIGTFGAVIKMKSPILTKRALIDVGIAGPLSGFVVAVIVTLIGLKFSIIVPATGDIGGISLGNSLIFKFLTFIVFGVVPEGHDVLLHPAAFAGWIGFFVTFLNLLPIGQLDGGHVVFAHLSRHHRKISIFIIALLVSFGVVAWPGWLVWAILVTLIGIWHPPIMDEHLTPGSTRNVLSVASFAVFILTFIPAPFYII
ncbi:MAG: site-2 protease family protein [Deltaproteobacteria bacterium]|nr:site-2 protease family protein [Deltaproteobacteria bacterium]